MALTVPFTALAATGKAARKARPNGAIFCTIFRKKGRKKNTLENGRPLNVVSVLISKATLYIELVLELKVSMQTKHVLSPASSIYMPF